MKRLLSLLVVFLIINPTLTLRAQYPVKNSPITSICYAGNKVKKIYIPPPAEFFKKSGSKSGGSIIIYCTGFSTQGKVAMEYAASILEKLLPSDAKFTINATWEAISNSGVLAQSSTTKLLRGDTINALNPFAYYPVALAEKIAGKSYNNDLDGDTSLTVNSSVYWYLGTDGQTPIQKYDLVTVALHEICHGLGFFDSMNANSTIGWYSVDGIFPTIYDTFVEDFNGNKLTDTLKYKNGSADLLSQLIGDQLYFNGPLLKNYTHGLRAKLYAPSTWDIGSSVSHLDESATLDINSLMTPFIDRGEAIHDPGKYTFSILGDLGWINTRIINSSMGDTEEHRTQITLSATIKSDTTYNHNKVGVVYSFNDFLTSDSLYLTSPNSNNSYNTTISIPAYNSDLQYYFFAVDCFLRHYRSPSAFKDFPHIKNNRYHIFIGTDTVKPKISHTPVAYYLQKVDSIKFNARVTDNLGIDSVYIEYKVNNGQLKAVRLNKGTSDDYSAVINARTLSLKGKDSILYRIVAVDVAGSPNKSMLPKTGFFVTHIEEITSTLQSYSTDFSNAAPDFFVEGFSISKPNGFLKFGLNTKHPYESPEEDNKTINYKALLRHPLKFNESGMLFSYNEIVLVEPGETGSVFGSEDFYDYVILEGSKNFGKTWFKLIDGYDSRIVSSWETAYKSSIVGNNSTYTGTEDMLHNHTFLFRPTDNISAGDTLLVRFRLFSDPYANGWGWVIEDLKINPLVDAIDETNYQPVSVYPNPGTGLIKISSDITGQEKSKPLHFKVFNTSGICLLNAVSSGSSETLADISNYPAGIYIIVLYIDDGIKTIKYCLIK